MCDCKLTEGVDSCICSIDAHNPPLEPKMRDCPNTIDKVDVTSMTDAVIIAHAKGRLSNANLLAICCEANGCQIDYDTLVNTSNCVKYQCDKIDKLVAWKTTTNLSESQLDDWDAAMSAGMADNDVYDGDWCNAIDDCCELIADWGFPAEDHTCLGTKFASVLESFGGVNQIAKEIKAKSASLEFYCVDVDLSDTGLCDIRLRWLGDLLELYSGPPCYDLDHRGYWAASSVGECFSDDECMFLAEDLVDQISLAISNG